MKKAHDYEIMSFFIYCLSFYTRVRLSQKTFYALLGKFHHLKNMWLKSDYDLSPQVWLFYLYRK